ncbi:MAG TPA: four helix bundle protein [Anaerolineales bacterium]|nr:four helix bundle protein [Anaerolineales bacterium]
MDEKTFKTRTKKLAVAIIHQTEKLPRSRAADVIGKQLVRSGTLIGANYRAACRAKSTADILSMTIASIKTLRNRKS